MNAIAKVWPEVVDRASIRLDDEDYLDEQDDPEAVRAALKDIVRAARFEDVAEESRAEVADILDAMETFAGVDCALARRAVDRGEATPAEVAALRRERKGLEKALDSVRGRKP